MTARSPPPKGVISSMATIELTMNGSVEPGARYLGWTPAPATVRVVGGGNGGDVAVRIESSAGAGRTVLGYVQPHQ